VSTGAISGLNLGFKTGDSSRNVEENRKKFFSVMGLDESNEARVEQVHSNKVVLVETPGEYKSADAMITHTPGLALTIRVADCLPVFLFDRNKRSIALIHAGWRGSAGEITSKAIDLMKFHFETQPDDLIALLGPSIGPCCYEIGPEVASQFDERFVRHNFLDLWAVNKAQILESGVPDNHITISELCTKCQPQWFFSHRGELGKTGRMLAIMGLKNEIS
jgi:YfiH family protein